MIFLNNLGEIKVFTHCSSQNKFIHLLINEFANLLIEKNCIFANFFETTLNNKKQVYGITRTSPPEH